MTTYYTQAQIDEIGALIGQEIVSSSETLKQFVQDKIAALEPVTPPAPTEPEAGDGTTPAPAAGMFLDDGREIKTKLFEFTVGYSQYQYESHGISQKIIGGSCLINDCTPNHNSEKYDYTFTIRANDIGIQLRVSDSNLRGGKAKVLITYLA